MNKDGVRVRVERLLNGRRNPDDLNRLFVFLRSRSHGERPVKEVGDFAAHHDRRDRGISWKRAGEIHHASRLFFGLQLRKQDEPYETTREQYARSMRAILELLGPALIKRDLKLSMKQAHRTLSSGLDKIEALAKSQPATLSAREKTVMDYIHRRFRVEPVFSQADLIRSLFTAMRKEGLITAEERPKLEVQAGFIATYVISLMHQCEVDLGNGETGTIAAGVGSDGCLVAAISSLAHPKVQVGAALFDTECHYSEWCDPTIDADFSRVFTWTKPLELDESGRLTEMD